MAQNDMYVVMYKVLCYLYDCMKRDVEPAMAFWRSVDLNGSQTRRCTTIPGAACPQSSMS